MAARCAIHSTPLGEDAKCQKCRSCTHQNFWMSAFDFKIGRFRCNNCPKVFKSVPAGKEVWVLVNGSWVDYYELIKKDKKELPAEIEEAVELRLATCLKCGHEFEPERSTAKYCSDKCRIAAARVAETRTKVTNKKEWIEVK